MCLLQNAFVASFENQSHFGFCGLVVRGQKLLRGSDGVVESSRLILCDSVPF